MKNKNKIQKNKGAAMMIVVLFFMFISLTILIGVITPVVREFKIVSDNFNSKQSYFLAESGVEDILLRLRNNMDFDANETLVLGTSSATTAITDISSSEKEIVSLGDINNIQRRVNTTVSTGVGVSFSYGVQSGKGGFLMDNNSSVIGSVYSNGNITGSGTITGSAISANSALLTSDQSNGAGFPDYDVTFCNTNITEDFAQSFKISENEIINKVQLYLKKVGNPSNLTVRIVTNSGGVPGTTTLTSKTLSSTLVSTTNYGWVEVPFDSNPELIAGTTYWLVIDGSYSSSKYYKIGANDNGYENGVSKIGKYNGTWNNNSPTSLDGFFNIYIGGINGLISGIDIGDNGVGIAHAHTVNSSTVEGVKYCQSTNNSPACDTSRPDPVQVPMPISEQNILDWKDEALTGGTYTGNYIVDDTSASLGPKKINGNLIVTNNANLTITGTVWVTGDITISNNAIVQLHSSYLSSDAVMINDGIVDVSNNAVFYGSGTVGSYIMILSTSSSSSAITLGNNAGAIVLYAANGTVNVSNNAGAKGINGYYIHLNNNAVITYESGLMDSNFVGGPSGSWNISQWKETE